MPLKNVMFTGREQAESRHGWPDWAIISISEPDYYPANLQPGWHSVLRLEFDDIVETRDPYVLFTHQQARVIIEFVRECHIRSCEGILVHCKAGVSRSAAVAKWVSEKHHLAFPAGYDLYNRHVYAVLRDEYLRAD